MKRKILYIYIYTYMGQNSLETVFLGNGEVRLERKEMCWALSNSVKNLCLLKRSDRLNLFKEESHKNMQARVKKENLLV